MTGINANNRGHEKGREKAMPKGRFRPAGPRGILPKTDLCRFLRKKDAGRV